MFLAFFCFVFLYYFFRPDLVDCFPPCCLCLRSTPERLPFNPLSIYCPIAAGVCRWSADEPPPIPSSPGSETKCDNNNMAAKQNWGKINIRSLFDKVLFFVFCFFFPPADPNSEIFLLKLSWQADTFFSLFFSFHFWYNSLASSMQSAMSELAREAGERLLCLSHFPSYLRLPHLLFVLLEKAGYESVGKYECVFTAIKRYRAVQAKPAGEQLCIINLHINMYFC